VTSTLLVLSASPAPVINLKQNFALAKSLSINRYSQQGQAADSASSSAITGPKLKEFTPSCPHSLFGLLFH
jgi:hypothetical protein